MILKTVLLGKTYQFRDLKELLAKANEEKTGDKLAGLAAENAREERAGYFKTGDGQLVLILNQPTTAAALAAQLENLRPLRSDIWGPEYATSAQNYSACGPYRVETVEPGLITLVRNENWYGQEDAQRPDLIRCKPMA